MLVVAVARVEHFHAVLNLLLVLRVPRAGVREIHVALGEVRLHAADVLAHGFGILWP